MARLNSRCKILLLLFCIDTASAAVSCSPGWDSFGGSCYKFIVTSFSVRGKSWENAENTCQSFGGHLTSITNQTEQNFIASKIRQYINEHFWIGFNDRANETYFNWTDATPKPFYKRWRRGEPNDFKNNEDCTELLYSDGLWNDDDCSKEYSFICKTAKGVPLPTQATVLPPTTLTPLYCDAGWNHYGTSCYKFNSANKKWTIAQRDCHQSGGYLVKVNDGDEQHYLTYTLKSMRQAMWLGLNDRAVEGTYIWEGDNTLLGKNYSHWYSGEPNDHAGNEDCIAMYTGSLAGFWNDDFCDAEKPYICEKPNGQNLCPVNWVPFGDSCYQMNTHPAQASTWPQARNACRTIQGSDMVSILSWNEQLFLLQQLQDLKSSNAWIGLSDIVSEGLFVWSDRSAFKYKNWARYEPSTWSSSSQDCTQLTVNAQNGTWATSYCNRRNTYVCKKKRASIMCDAPFGMANNFISDSQISASSSKNVMSRPSLARLGLQPSNGSSGGWCAANNQQGEYLQIDLGLVRQIKHIALQGKPTSSDFVKTFYIRFGNDGLNFINYGENATVQYKVITGSSSSNTVANVMLSDPINGRFLRIYPLTWSNNICLKTEIYGCASAGSSLRCGVGWEEGPDDTCYQFNTNQLKIWADARANCYNQGGDLLSIVTNKEKTYIENRLKPLASSVGSLWIGLNDRESNRLFYWSDRSPYVITRWDAGYPKDTTNSKSCVELVASRAAWRDVDCGQYKPFVCKRKIGSAYGQKYSMTANWISATDYYWPLDKLANGRVLGTRPAQVVGNVHHPDLLQNGKDVLQFRSYNSYLNAGEYPSDCISDADACNAGMSVSLIVRLDSSASSWTNRVFLFDSIGDEASSRGFSIYIESGQLKVKVFTRKRTWSLSTSLQNSLWQHVLFTWQTGTGLKLYINGRVRTQRSLPSYLTPLHTSNNAVLTIGTKSTQKGPGGYYMRALAVWKRELSSNDVTDIYNAEFGNCKTGWKAFGQYCYQFNSQKKTWLAARQQCQIQGGDLVSITSPVEQAHITLEVGQFNIGQYAWIGFHDKSIESAWEWSDGSPVRFTNWYNVQPDNWYNREDCAHTYHQSFAVGRWNDMGCTSNLAYICKSKKAYVPNGGMTPTTAPRTKIICDYTSDILSCPVSTVISVQTANYGRTSSNHCGQISFRNCRSDVTNKVRNMCEGKTYCSIRPTPQLLGEPCSSVTKYLEATYFCKKGTDMTPGCPSGWQRSPDGNVCYGLVLDKKTWYGAQDSCRQYGADLASVHSGWESAMLTSLLVTSWDAGDVWIGLTDFGERGVYRWADNSTVDFTHWWNGEPNDRNRVGSCVRATMTVSSRDWMYWLDTDCTAENFAFVCKMFRRNVTAPTSLPTTAATGPCSAGWSTYLSGCYKVFMSHKTWTAARDACRATGQNTDLVSIHNTADNAFVQTLTNSSFNVWIGLNDRGIISGHLWSDGTAVQFTSWGPVQPDSHSGQQPCVVLKSTGSWNDVGCYSARPYMCKRKRPARATTPGPSTNGPITASPVPGICEPGWIYWNQLCYQFNNESSSSQLSWIAARSVCRQARGDLVSLRTAAENSFVLSEVKRRYASWTVWIGLNDLGSEGIYTWSDSLPLAFTNFAYKEPNDWMGLEDCMEMRRYDGKWNDQNCNLKRPFVCRKHNTTVFPAFTMVPPTPGPAVGKCDAGWVNYDKSCYKFVFKERQNWINAQAVCSNGQNSSNGNLVAIDNMYEQAFITTMLKGYQGTLWIGFNDRHTEGSYSWVDNSPVRYTNWEKGRPSYNYFADCVGMSTNQGSLGQWDVQVCSTFQGYICETAALPLGPTPLTPTPNADCPALYTKYGDACYLMYYTKLNWYEAREVCKKNGADLISIHSSFEQAYLGRNMKDFLSDVWIGMTRAPNSLEFTWSDQSIKEYSHWSRGQPGQPGSSQTCVQANNSMNSDGRWTALDCGRTNGFMCKINKGEPHVTPSLLGQCLPGWKKFDKYCYLFRMSNWVSWPQAHISCHNQGGDLVSVLSRHEKDFLVYQLKETRSSTVWIGLNDRAIERGWQWSDGSPLSYVAWNFGEPNDHIGSENCVEMYPRSGMWNDNSCAIRGGYICKSKLECSFALGMSSGNITDAQLSASSTLDRAVYGPSMARLNGSSAWCANASMANNYIQVDFQTPTRVSKISIKGAMYGGSAAYVQLYTVTYGTYKNQWKTYQQNGQPWVFSANRDARSVVTISLDPPIDARFLRLNPRSWVNNICAKLEFYGCLFECETALGMETGKIKDDVITTTSSLSPSHAGTESRPTGQAWCPKSSDKNPWIQLTLNDPQKRITKLSTWGAGTGGSGFVSKYQLAFSDDGVTWTDYTEKGVVRNFRGNNDLTNRLTHVLGEPIITKYFRIKPLSGDTAGMCMRFEIYGCPSGCLDPLGLELGTIEDSWLSSSSKLDENHGPDMARLNAPRGWCAATNDKQQYLQIDLSRPMRVRQIATQGSPDGTGFVKSFILTFKRDDIPWKNIREGNTVKRFTANTDGSTVVKTIFPKGVRGQYFRVKPQSWSNRICIRVELYGCLPNNPPTVSPPTELPSGNPTGVNTAGPTKPPYDVYKAAMILLKMEWTYDYTKKSSAAYKRLASQVESSVSYVYRGTTDKDSLAFVAVKVTGFRRGSVIVDFNMTFFADISQGVNVTDKLRAAVMSGKVDELDVDPKNFNITKVVPNGNGGKTKRIRGDRGGLSSGAKAAIAVVFVIVAIAGGAALAWYFLKRKRAGKLMFQHQQFDNPIHFSSKAYDMES